MKEETINILVIGNANVGKSTIINALGANYLSKINSNSNKNNNDQKKNFASFIDGNENNIVIDNFFENKNCNISVKLVDVEGYENNDECKSKLIEISQNIDIFLVVYDLNNIDKCDLLYDIIDIVKRNTYGYIFMIINKCDDVILNENGIVDSMNFEKYNCICNNLKDKYYFNSNNIIPLKGKDAYLYRYLYYYDNDTILNEKTEKDIDDIIQLQIGKVMYKNMLNSVTNLESKKKYLKKKFDLDDIYSNAMNESGYTNFENKIEICVKENFDTILKKHIENDLEKIKVKECDINEIFENLISIIEKTEIGDNVNYDKIISYLNSNFREKISAIKKSPEKISMNIINKLNDINNEIKEKWNNEILLDEIASLKIIRNDNMIEIFKYSFDEEILGEIKNKITPDILYMSLNNNINKNMNYDEYLSNIEKIAYITEFNIEYITTASLCFIKFIDYNKNHQIIIQNCINKLLVQETNDNVSFILLNLLNTLNEITNKAIIYDANMPNSILVINYDDYKNQNDIFLRFYNVIKKLFDCQKVSKLKSSFKSKKSDDSDIESTHDSEESDTDSEKNKKKSKINNKKSNNKKK
jgi:hypothetical protein